MLVELGVDPIEVLRVVAEMDADERRLRVALDDALERGEKLLAGRVLLRVAEPPARMVFELLPAFVLLVVGEPEGLRVGHVDGHGHPQAPERVPHGVEARVVDLVEGALLVAQEEPQALELLEAGGAETVPLLDLRDGLLGEVGGLPVRVVEVHVLEEATRELPVRQLFGRLELRRLPGGVGDGPSAELYRDSDARGVHDADGAGHSLRGGFDVGVEIDEAMRGTPGGRDLGEVFGRA